MKKTLLTLALSSAVMSFNAQAVGLYDEFTVDEGSVPGALANTFVADYFNGAYDERYTITAGVSGLTFATSAYADFSALFADEGTTLLNHQIGSNIHPENYRVYALFTAAGTVSAGAGGAAAFNGQSGTFSMYIDVNSNTTKALGATGGSPVILGNTSDDYLIASSSSLVSLANVFGNPGAFDLWFKDFTLSSGDQNATFAGDQNGENYFIQPRPFHLVTNVDGDFNNISFADIGTEIALTGAFTRRVGGDVSAVFIPEPSTVALFGLGLTGLALSLRRRKAA